MKRVLLALLAVAALAAAAVPALAATKTVRLVDNAFAPKTLTVSRGTTVVFRHAGENPHDVVVTKGPQRFSSPQLRGTQSFRHRFTRRGGYTLVCTIHPGMRMSLRVR